MVMKEKKGVEKERRLKVMNKISSWLKDASGKSHYFNGGMKASSKLDF